MDADEFEAEAAILARTDEIIMERIRFVLEGYGLQGHKEQAEALAEWVGVTRRTARRWIEGQTVPRRRANLSRAVAEKTRVPLSYLRNPFSSLAGVCSNYRTLVFVEYCSGLSDSDQSCMLRFLTRYRNGSPKIERLMKATDAGQISFLEMVRQGGA